MKFLRRRLSIHARLLLLVLAIVVPGVGIFAYYVVDESQESREAAYAKVKIVAADTSADLDQFLHAQEALLARLAARPLVRALDPRNCDPIIGEYVQLHPEITTLSLRDTRGNLICSVSPNPPRQDQVIGYAWFQQGLRSGKFTASDVYRGQASGRWLSVLTYPVRDDRGEVSGLIGLAVDLLQLNEHVFAHSPKNALQVVLDRGDRFLLRSADPAAWIGKPLPGPQADAVRGMHAGVLTARGTDDVRRLYAVETVAATGWRVFAGLPEDEVFADFWDRLVHGVIVGFAVLLLVLALAWHISRAIARPIRELAGVATRIAAGESDARARVDGPAEIEFVAREFNRMRDVQERQREERAALIGHFEQLVRLARDIFLLFDPSGKIVEANDAAVAAYGYSADELRDMNIRDLRAPDAQATLAQDWQATMNPGGALFETVHRRRDGGTFPVEVSSRKIDIEGKPYRQSFVRDITGRHAAEAQIRRLNTAYAMLSETNQAIVRLRDPGELFPRICRIAVEFGGYAGAWVGLVDKSSRRLVPAAVDGSIGDYVRQLTISTDPAEAQGRGPAALALREGRPYYCRDILGDPSTEPWHALAAQFGVRSLAALPLHRAGAVVGTLNLYSSEPGGYDAATSALLEEMAVDISFALDNFDRDAARRQAEEAVARSEARFRSIIETAHDAFILIGSHGELLDTNNATSEISGYSREQLLRMTLRDLEAVESDEEFARTTAEVIAAGHARFERTWRHQDGRLLNVEISTTYMGKDRGGYFFSFIHDITGRKQAELAMRESTEQLERATQSTLEAVSHMVELRDPYTAGHEHRVGELAAAIGAEMGLPEDTVKGLRLAGYVHDIGKISVPAEILSKPSRLTPMEFALIKGHSQSGHDVLKGVDFPWPLAEVILQHHERLDGSGYPRQMMDGEILLEARIMAVADVVEAMSSHRPYRPGLGMDAALEEIGANSGKLYDPDVAAACLRLFRDRGYVLAK